MVMINISLNPKNTRKYQYQSSNKKLLPTKWLDFAKLCKIRSGAKIVNFNPYEYQVKLIECIDKNQTTIITKTRQLGISELIINYFLFNASVNPGYLGVIFSKTQSDTSNLAKRIRRQIDGLYEYIETENNNLQDIQIKNGGRILFRNSTPNGARGLESVSHILYDEASFVDEIEEIYKSSIPCTTTLGKDARIIILSTPNGQSGWYWDKLSCNNGERDLLQVCDEIKAEKIEPYQHWIDDNGWCKFIIHWLAHPVFSKQKETYLSDIKKQFELPDEMIEQEYNLSFSNSESIVFSPSLIRENATGTYKEYENDGIYYFGIDTSLLGNDYTVCSIIQEINGKFDLVKMYRERKKSHEYNIYQISELIEQYRPITVGIEVNSSGRIYFDELQKQHLGIDFKEIKTTAQSKPILINQLILMLEKNLLSYPNDKKIIEEFLSFRDNNGSLGAMVGKHDDIVMSLSFAITGIS